MGIKEIKTESLKTTSSIEEPMRYGEKDKFREIIIPHSTNYRSEIQKIKKERIKNLNVDPYKGEIEKVESVAIPEVGSIYFIYSFDNEYSSATYRKDAHNVLGPYIIDEH